MKNRFNCGCFLRYLLARPSQTSLSTNQKEFPLPLAISWGVGRKEGEGDNRLWEKLLTRDFGSGARYYLYENSHWYVNGK